MKYVDFKINILSLTKITDLVSYRIYPKYVHLLKYFTVLQNAFLYIVALIVGWVWQVYSIVYDNGVELNVPTKKYIFLEEYWNYCICFNLLFCEIKVVNKSMVILRETNIFCPRNKFVACFLIYILTYTVQKTVLCGENNCKKKRVIFISLFA